MEHNYFIGSIKAVACMRNIIIQTETIGMDLEYPFYLNHEEFICTN